MTRPLRTLTRCLVCGFAEIRTDEVIDRGLVLLAECPRCLHRWTARAPRGEPRIYAVHEAATPSAGPVAA